MADSSNAKKPRVVRTNISLLNSTVPVYAGTRVARALHEVTLDMDIYRGVRLAELLEAVYDQGKKDGARLTFEKIEEVKALVPHKNPGRPRKATQKRK